MKFFMTTILALGVFFSIKGQAVDEDLMSIRERLLLVQEATAHARRFSFRIGINISDVIQEKERIYGDGVNIAARLEGLAKPGGICISRAVYDHVENKLPYAYAPMGDQIVKNIAKPVGAYQILINAETGKSKTPAPQKEGAARRRPVLWAISAVIAITAAIVIWQFQGRWMEQDAVLVQKTATAPHGKPFIAVLPFDNMSDDPEQEYFSDGMTEEIISGLSRIPRLRVIARNSTFTYKGKSVRVRDICKDLDAQFVLEGSVRRAGQRVRVTAQLIDAIDGKHLWAQRYDREIKDIFKLQDEITIKIINALRIKKEPKNICKSL